MLDHIVNVPSGWSTRVGLYGGWGSGKTSILGLLEDMAVMDGHVTCYVQAWRVKSVDELVDLVVQAVHACAKQPRYRNTWLENFVIELSRLIPRANRKATTDSVTALEPSLVAHTTLANSVLEIGDSLRRHTSGDGTLLAQELGARRVLVFIDDLDRLDPAVVPYALLVLRDGLAIPGFTFVLPFDDRTAAKAIALHHPAWGDGYEFLDKVIDVAFLVPPTDARDVREIFLSSIRDDSLKSQLAREPSVEAFLPANPRKAKQIARRLEVAHHAQSRREAGELSTETLLLLECIRAESPRFVLEILNHAGQLPVELMGAVSSTDIGAQQVEEFFKRCELAVSPHREMLLRRVYDLVAFTPYHALRAHALVSEEEVIVTQKEARTYVDLVKNSVFDAGVVGDFFNEVTAHTALSKSRVCLSLATQILVSREKQLDRAASERIGRNQGLSLQAVEASLHALDCLLLKSESIEMSGKEWGELLGFTWKQFTSWSHFTRNPGEKKLRKLECSFISRLVENYSTHAVVSLQVLKPEERNSFGRADLDAFKLTLSTKCARWISGSILEQLLSGKLPSLEFEGNQSIERFVLVESRKSVLTRLGQERQFKSKYGQIVTSVRQAFALRLMSTIQAHLDGQASRWRAICDGRTNVAVKAVAAVWSSATCSRWNFRMQRELVLFAKMVQQSSEGACSLSIPAWVSEEQRSASA
ncbi:MAG: hypothetical protein KA763_02480 [Xanthomonadales bacterium]|nr:hypothetical protein [Xanthomonadales bacterium]